MKRYDEIILNKLIDKYETSSLYDNRNKRNVSIVQRIEKNAFPEYFDETSLKYQDLHIQLESAEEKGFIKLYWKNRKRGTILEKCELNTDNTDEIYKYLGRNPKSAKVLNAIESCQKLLDTEVNNELTKLFVRYVIQRLKDNEPWQKYLDINDIKTFEKNVHILDCILNNRDECFIRDFSIKNTGDSKIAEKDISHLCSIIRSFSKNELLSGLNDEELLREFGIIRNPVYIHIKGFGRFLMKDTEIDLSCFDDGVGISGRDAEKIVWDKCSAPEIIITVENLTSFHKLKESLYGHKILCVYLGGYQNSDLIQFVKKIFSAFPKSKYYHFGDIDCGGFLIWRNLVEKTGVCFKTAGMDEVTYLNGVPYGRELSEYDRKTLRQMVEEPFFADQRNLFRLMLDTGIKTEQEYVDSNDLLTGI